jgi:hypothetical protein
MLERIINEGTDKIASLGGASYFCSSFDLFTIYIRTKR